MQHSDQPSFFKEGYIIVSVSSLDSASPFGLHGQLTLF
jgi:hypothetical protein